MAAVDEEVTGSIMLVVRPVAVVVVVEVVVDGEAIIISSSMIVDMGMGMVVEVVDTTTTTTTTTAMVEVISSMVLLRRAGNRLLRLGSLDLGSVYRRLRRRALVGMVVGIKGMVVEVAGIRAVAVIGEEDIKVVGITEEVVAVDIGVVVVVVVVGIREVKTGGVMIGITGIGDIRARGDTGGKDDTYRMCWGRCRV